VPSSRSGIARIMAIYHASVNDFARMRYWRRTDIRNSNVATHDDACSLSRVPMAMHGP
jgi:hypothetical protein